MQLELWLRDPSTGGGQSPMQGYSLRIFCLVEAWCLAGALREPLQCDWVLVTEFNLSYHNRDLMFS